MKIVIGWRNPALRVALYLIALALLWFGGIDRYPFVFEEL